jgi:hypothetical protein
MSPLTLCQHNKCYFLLNCLSVPCLFENPTKFLGALVQDSEMVFFHLPCHRGALPWPPHANRQFDLEERLTLLESQSEGLRCTMEPGEAQEPVRGAPPTRLVRILVQILGLSLSGRKEAWSPPRVTWVALNESKIMTLRHWEQGGTLDACVWTCVNEI